MPVPSETVTLPARGYRIAPRVCLIAGLACWLAFALVAWCVASGRAHAIDAAGLLFWRDADLRPLGPPALLEAVRDVTALGGVLLRNLFALGAVAALAFLRLRREAVLLAATIATGWFVEVALKHLVGRPRPMIVPHLTEAGSASFPSGHSFNSAVVYIAMALAFAALSPRREIRVTILACATMGSLAVAFSRVWLGVHWPTDVIAGWLGGTGWAFLASALLYRPARAAADASA